VVQPTSPTSPRPLTAVEPEFREDQLAGQSPVAHGVKCHVSHGMAGHETTGAIAFFKKKKANLFRLRAEVCDLHSLAFVVVSGTAVAPTESCELSRFEIP
jgi:hypothetical protein